MKSFVAFLLVLTAFYSGVTRGQSPSRAANQRAASQPRSATLRICQGVPIPDGYVIIAYMTSTACPHGAYLLQKQNSYESSLAVNGSARKTSVDSAESANEAAARSSGTSPRNRTASPGQVRKAITSARTSREPQTSAPQPGAASATSGGASASITRPRRV